MNDENKFSIEDEIDLRKLFTAFLNKKILIVSLTSFFAISAIIISLLIPNQYQSFTVVAPINNSAQQIGGSISTSALGGLASLAGIDLPNEGVSEAKIAIQVMQSWGFIEQFIKRNNLEKYLVAVVGWDSKNDELIYDDGIFDSNKNIWIESKPSSWALYKAFRNRLSVEEDLKTGMTTISFKYFSPTISKDMIQLLIQDINNFMKERKLETVDRSIIYLQEQINKTIIKDMENIFYQIIAEQTKSKMLAEATPEYTFVTISKPMVPQEKSEPTRSLIVIISTIIGFLFSLVTAIILSLREGFSLQPDNNVK
tara:strand:- start:791 stop:1726 length:936 start_codon:yes stop_codon:yes gene_type:complete